MTVLIHAEDVEELFDGLARTELQENTVANVITDVQPTADLSKQEKQNCVEALQIGFKRSCLKHFSACAENRDLRDTMFEIIYEMDTLMFFEFNVVEYVKTMLKFHAVQWSDFWVKLSDDFDSFLVKRHAVLRYTKEYVDNVFAFFATERSKDSASKFLKEMRSLASLNYNKMEDKDRINLMWDRINICCKKYFPDIARKNDRNQVKTMLKGIYSTNPCMPFDIAVHVQRFLEQQVVKLADDFWEEIYKIGKEVQHELRSEALVAGLIPRKVRPIPLELQNMIYHFYFEKKDIGLQLLGHDYHAWDRIFERM